ncbi:nucleotide sugar dehydrogenase [Tautonia plasticadhaerens]|uniref:UDP-N-acetyl-D-glucosamine 6-dehydrogenase n=1 Tax=Tautonia plasticadhaerens TaxID=2527974 RepID=A0A518HDP2_9BACT|nr:nucleotide sugar dehydrogenase [Tautonia plasticadhaerens]QDV38975.1 UDP-N-acetyl-D-glucosamine 6-dehydrogenase [Tautonia plasticadhaerens]
MANQDFPYDVCIVGGCGHVGLPLAITFASKGLKVNVFDINEKAVETVRSGRMPFLENGAEEVLRRVVGKTLEVGTDPALASRAEHVVVVIGTPVDEHLNPTFHTMRRFFQGLIPHLRAGQTVILRSTVFPGTTEKIRDLIASENPDVHVAFCPERVAEGKAMEELVVLPQIVSGCDEHAIEAASRLFGTIAHSLIRLTPQEAELTKIFANVWRYIQFAAANQFFMIAADHGLDFYRVFDALTRDYPRMSGLPRSGFAAGPCLFKDTMQLSAAYNNNFALGHAAMLVNEGLPNFLVRHAKQRFDLSKMTVGLLGMAFKAESDDPRESLSYKLRKLLEYEAGAVLCSDEYIKDPGFLPAEEVVSRADLLFVGVPHRRYRGLEIPAETPIVDVWNLYGRGAFPG